MIADYPSLSRLAPAAAPEMEEAEGAGEWKTPVEQGISAGKHIKESRGSPAALSACTIGRTVLSQVDSAWRGRMNTTLASEVLIQKASPVTTSVEASGIRRKQTDMGGINHE